MNTIKIILALSLLSLVSCHHQRAMEPIIYSDVDNNCVPICNQSKSITKHKFDSDTIGKALGAGKILLFYFHDPADANCKKMATTTFLNQNVVEMVEKHFYFVTIDTVKESAIAKAILYVEPKVPTSLFVTLTYDDKWAASQLEDYVTPKQYLSVLEHVRDGGPWPESKREWSEIRP